MNDLMDPTMKRRISSIPITMLVLSSPLLVTGCGKQLFPDDRPWQMPRSALETIEGSDLQQSAVLREPPSEDAVARILEGAVDFAEYPERTQLSLAEVRASALENNLELRATIMDPAIAEAGFDAESARFESTFVASVNQNESNQQITNQDQSAQSSSTSVNLGLEVPLQTGGTLSFSTPFSRNTQDSQFAVAEFDSYWSAGVRFSVAQPLLRNAGLRVNTAPIRVASYRSQIAQAQAKLAATRILGNAEKAYWRLYAAWQELDVRKQQYDLAVEQMERAQRLVDAAQAAEIEVIRAESGVGSSLEAIIRADAAIRRAQRELKKIMNRSDLPLDSPTALEPSSVPNPVGLEIDATAMARDAVDNRMEVLELDLQLAIDASDIEVARNATLPDIAIRYDWPERQPGSLANTYESRGFYAPGPSVSASIPIGNEQAEPGCVDDPSADPAPRRVIRESRPSGSRSTT